MQSKPADAEPLPGSILIADDHDVVRYGLAQLLRRAFRPEAILEAGTFEAALEALETNNVTLALFDLGMPGLGGAQSLSQVRDRWPAIRLVVVSGSEDREHVLASLAARAHGYIVKSAGKTDIVEEIRMVLAGRIVVPALIAEPSACESPALAQDDATAVMSSSVLSERKLDVLRGLTEGLTNREIAERLELAEGTVKMHVAALLRVLKANNRAHAAALGKRLLG